MTRKSMMSVALFAALFSVAMLRTVRASDADQEAQLRETRSCVNCDLSGANLTGVIAELGDLRDANLSFANLYLANLAGANLAGASLNGADLSGAVLSHAKGADLTGATTDERTVCPNGERGPCK